MPFHPLIYQLLIDSFSFYLQHLHWPVPIFRTWIKAEITVSGVLRAHCWDFFASVVVTFLCKIVDVLGWAFVLCRVGNSSNFFRNFGNTEKIQPVKEKIYRVVNHEYRDWDYELSLFVLPSELMKNVLQQNIKSTHQLQLLVYPKTVVPRSYAFRNLPLSPISSSNPFTLLCVSKVQILQN